jgi:hypothetical protein
MTSIDKRVLNLMTAHGQFFILIRHLLIMTNEF